VYFKDYSDESHLWAYGFAARLTAAQANTLRNELANFCENWKVHGKLLKGTFELFDDQFVLLATDGDISGCSIDSSVALFKNIKLSHGLDALDPNLMFYRGKRGIEAVSRIDFKTLVAEGEISDKTPVFNLSVSNVGDLRKGFFERPFEQSWHAKAFKQLASF